MARLRLYWDQGAARQGFIALTLLGFTALIRLRATIFPSFQWDESTFLTVGQRTFSGELPYTSTLENKPPLGTLLHGLPSLFGSTDLRIARFAALCLAAGIAWLLSRLCFESPAGSWLQLPVGLVAVWLLAIIPGGEAWMSELNVVAFFALAAFALRRAAARSSSSIWGALSIGLAIGMVPCTRTNWLLAGFVLLGYSLLILRTPRLRLGLIAGFVVPFATVAGLYAATGNWSRLVLGALDVPVEASRDSGGDLSLPEGMLQMAIVATLLLAAAIWIERGEGGNRVGFMVAMLVVCWAVVVPSLPQWVDYDHHSMQMVPFVVIGFGCLASALATARGVVGKARWLVGTVVVAGLAIAVLAAPPVWSQRLLTSSISGWGAAKSTYGLETRFVEAFSNRPRVRGASVLALQYHFVMYRLGMRPVVPEAVHPSMFTNPAVLRVEYGSDIGDAGAVQRAMAKRPRFVIFVPGPLDPTGEKALLRQLAADYRRLPLGQPFGVDVFERIASSRTGPAAPSL